MENFKNVDALWVDVAFDQGRHYSVPWQWGTVGISVNTKVYKGDINTSAIIFDPPPELEGKINVVPEMTDVMDAAIVYIGGQCCTADKELLKKVRDKLVEAKPHWVAMDYATIEKIAKGDYLATCTGTARPCVRACRMRTSSLAIPRKASPSSWTISPCSRMRKMSRTPSSSRTS